MHSLPAAHLALLGFDGVDGVPAKEQWRLVMRDAVHPDAEALLDTVAQGQLAGAPPHPPPPPPFAMLRDGTLYEPRSPHLA